MLGEKYLAKKPTRFPQENKNGTMSVWSEEKMKRWVHERRTGMQSSRDWKNYPQPFSKIDWMKECGCQQCKSRNPCTWARVSMMCHGIRSCYIRKEPTHFFPGSHYEIRGCNLHDKSEWIQYKFS